MTDHYGNPHQLAPSGAYQEYPVAPQRDEQVVSPVAKVHRVLRGRYRWVIGLSLVLGGIGVTLGLTLPKPIYRSYGLINVAAKVPRVLFDREEKGLLPMFESYVNTQAVIAGSRRVIDMAMQSPEWQAFGRGLSDKEVAKFQGQLGIFHPRSSETIEVSFTDEDPAVTIVAVNQLIKAYMKVVDERENGTDLQRLQALEKRRAIDNSQLTSLRRDVLNATSELGVEAQEARYQSLIDQWNKLTGALCDLDIEIATVKAVGANVPFGSPDDVTVEQIAATDTIMAALIDQREEAQFHLEGLGKQGLLSEHPAIKQQQGLITSIDRKISRRAIAVRAQMAKAPAQRAAELAEQQAQRERLVAQRDAVQEETKKYGKKMLVVSNYQADQNSVQERIAQAKNELDQMTVESDIHGRITVLAWGERPLGPETDRRNQLAVAGGVGGVAAAFALVILWGMRNSRLRHIVDVDGGAAGGRFLGILPELSSERVEGQPLNSTDMGDYCVHHVRTMLQLRSPRTNRAVVLTSPTSGAGKTTLSLALGMSFAATGQRTLLVDLDFVGHGLTSAMRGLVCELTTTSLASRAAAAAGDTSHAKTNGRRSPTALALAARRVTVTQREAHEVLGAARAAAADGDAAAARAVAALEALERSSTNGILDAGEPRVHRGALAALAGAPLSECIVPTEVPGLTLLPVGDASAKDAQCLSPAAVEQLIAACRANYDTIIIDTGPVLGSLEAALVGAVADEVLLVVARGERQPLVDEAQARLAQIGADVAGVVFNRATSADVARSSYSSRSASVHVGQA